MHPIEDKVGEEKKRPKLHPMALMAAVAENNGFINTNYRFCVIPNSELAWM